MVISFSADTAYSFLRRSGYVATFRASRRERPNVETWANRGRGKKKSFDVRISEVGEFDPSRAGTPMADLAGASGFGSLQDWRDAIEDLHGDVPSSGWVYFVTTLPMPCGKCGDVDVQPEDSDLTPPVCRSCRHEIAGEP